MKSKWVIIGVTDDGAEHFIGCSFDGDSWFKMKFRAWRMRLNRRISEKYRKIELKNAENLVWRF